MRIMVACTEQGEEEIRFEIKRFHRFEVFHLRRDRWMGESSGEADT